ncbi:probable flavin-containing monoamine oxidase B [Sabethes cyaneus]|uniref:probable flavin-containing monoamine oxidase B n=1 Tax=Sabethes cyaneus TaxID=53552 RepID=UPI00237DDDA5|nr:probable flavin-containing monoamine oxidase B [Sabethes cyaneus]
MSNLVDAYDVIIIGAGLSGLCAARCIRDRCPAVNFKVMEQSTKAGGQLDGFKSRWITSNNFHATELCRELGVVLVEMGQLVPKHSDCDLSGLQDITPFPGHLFGTLSKIESEQLVAEFDSLCSSRFVIEDPMNMDVFLERKLLLNASKEFFRFLIKINCGFSAEELSVTDWIKFCRSLSSTSSAYEMLTKSDTHLIPIEGWSELVAKLVEAVGIENITFSNKITRVEYSSEDFALVWDEKGRCSMAKTVICAVSCNELIRIDFIPFRPICFKAPNSTSNFTHVTNFRTQYQSCLWRNHHYSGTLFRPSFRIICFEKDNQTLEGSFFHLANLNDYEIKCAILNIISLSFGCRSLLYPNTFEMARQELPFHFEVPVVYSRRLIFSSSNASCWYRGFNNGSVQAGNKAAILALLEVRPQSVSYKDVTDTQCVLFKYSHQLSTGKRFWRTINFSSVSRFAAAFATLAASLKVILQMGKNLSGLNELETE